MKRPSRPVLLACPIFRWLKLGLEAKSKIQWSEKYRLGVVIPDSAIDLRYC